MRFELKNIPFFLLIFFCNFLFSQEISLKKGVVVDSIQVNDSIPETYAVYLPSNFSMDKTWPVIFVLDPDGRGRTAAQLFRQAAEEQGYIVAASNNIRDEDSLLNNLKVSTRLLNGVFNYFPIDRNRIYTAGLAEGARAASALPTIFGTIQGVMAVGDVWINPEFAKQDNSYSFIGLAGYKDHIMYTLEESVRFFNRNKIPASLYKFNGSEEWPSADVVSNALGEFTLQAMAKGYMEEDPALVETLYRNEMETAETLRRTLEFYKAYQLLEQMEQKYAPFDKKDELKEKQKNLRRSRVFKTQRREYRRAKEDEQFLKAEYFDFFNLDVVTANFENLGWWSQQLKELREFQEGEDQAKREMAHRLEGFLQSLAENTVTQLNNENASIDQLIFTNILRTIYEPKNPEGYMSIISLSASDGDYGTALLYLEDLLKTGYDDLEALYDIPGTLDLKLSPEFNALVKKYLGESKYYNIEEEE